jgi:fused signal recognition particle receptor
MRTFGEAPPPPTFLERLTSGLAKKGGLSDSLVGIFTKKKLDGAAVAALEDALIGADMGAAQSAKLAAAVAKGRYDAEISDRELRAVLAREVAALLAPIEKPLEIDETKKPFVILVSGVNGTGKTTTIGKIARRLVGGGAKVTLAAGDTFRAAAVEQLRVWAERAGAGFVSTKAGGDAAGLAFEALEKARADGCDILIIDTAGRLQNKAGLMAELEKIARVIKKLDPGAPHAALLVLDATTGQNAILQAKNFGQAIKVTGIMLSKLDGSAKGGVVMSIKEQLNIPVKFVGLGETPQDIETFDPQRFVDALFGEREPV